MDARNRLLGISGSVTANFAYDPLGRRTSKTINGMSTQFVYDGNDVTAEIGSGAVSTAYLRSLNIDEMFGFLRQDGAYFSIYDGLGSTLTLTNQAGSSSVQYTYEPFGKTQPSVPTFANPFQFTSRENDNTGLYYNRLRYYAPSRYRFTSEDPIGILGGVNAYSYVLNNPISFTDPFGLDVTVTLYPGASGAGHIGVGVNTTQTVGLYPAATANTVAMAMGLNVQGVVQPDNRQPIQTITIPTSAQQDVIVQNLLNQSLASPQTYNLYVRNWSYTRK